MGKVDFRTANAFIYFSIGMVVSIPYMGKVGIKELRPAGDFEGIKVSIPYMGKVEQHFVDVFIIYPTDCLVN